MSTAQSSRPILFVELWAFAMVVDTLVFIKSPFLETICFATILAATAVIFNPTSLIRFILLAFLSVTKVIYQMPHEPNHWVAVLTMNLTILAAGLFVLVRKGNTRSSLQTSFVYFAPALRAQLILMYFVAALHKTNWDYLDPTVSCATDLASNLLLKLHLSPELLPGQVAAFGSLAFEYGIPLLLLFKGTRYFGIAAGLVFHFFLGFDTITAVASFSCVIYALYALFVPESLAVAIIQLNWLPRKRKNQLLLVLTFIILACALTLVATNTSVSNVDYFNFVKLKAGPSLHKWYHYVSRFLWFFFAQAAILSFFVVPKRGWRKTSSQTDTQTRYPFRMLLQIVFSVLFLANGLGPYFGYKTVPTLSMFSNLRTEAGKTNHLFMGTARLFPLDSDVIEIIDSSSHSLRRLANEGLLLTYWEFRKLNTPWVSRLLGIGRNEIATKDFWVTYKRNEKTIRLSRSQNPNTEAFSPPPWFASKLLSFRLIPANSEKQVCVW